MKAAASKLLIAIVLLLLSAPSLRAADESYDLLAHGNSQTLWVAEVKPSPLAGGNLRTVFRFRHSGDFAHWTAMGEVATRIVQLSDRGNELIVLLENGDWMLGSPSGFRSGVPLPGQGAIVAIAGDAETVWAIGEDLHPPPATEPDETPTTRDASEIPSTASTGPGATIAATRPVPLGLFNLVEGVWEYAAPLPEGITRADVQAMVLLDHHPLVAFAAPRHMVRVMSFANDEWKLSTEIGPVSPKAAINLLELQNRPIIALQKQSNISVFVRGEKWSPAIKLQPTAETSRCPYHAVAAGLGQLRVLCSTGPRKLIEQAYNLKDGSPSGNAYVATEPETIALDKITYASVFIATIVFLGIMFGAMGRRTAIAQAASRVEELNLAPLGSRFAAGMIDAIPLLVVPMFIGPATSATSDVANRLTVEQAMWFGIAMGVYVLHTAILEMVTGRSLGKMFFGLRVVGLDGNPASQWELLLRNLLRVIDVVLLFPLALMIFLPLRQRLGDLAGGTLVVRDPEANKDHEAEDGP